MKQYKINKTNLLNPADQKKGQRLPIHTTHRESNDHQTLQEPRRDEKTAKPMIVQA